MRRLALVLIYSVLMFSSACGVAHAGGGGGGIVAPQGFDKSGFDCNRPIQ